MADSFFQFNTTLTGCSGLDDAPELDEEEYDALNHETFGDNAFQGDWEADHTRFAEVTESSRSYPKFFDSDNDDLDEDDDDLDLEASLSHLVLEEGEDEEESAVVNSKSIVSTENLAESQERYTSSSIWSVDTKKLVSPTKYVQETGDPSASVHSAIHFLPPQIPKMPTVQELERDLMQRNRQNKAVAKEVKTSIANSAMNQVKSVAQTANQQVPAPLSSNAIQQQNVRSKFTYCVGTNKLPPGFGNIQMSPFLQPPQQEMVFIRNNMNVPMMLGARLMPPYILPNPPLLLPQNPPLVSPHMMRFVPPHPALVPQQQQQQQQQSQTQTQQSQPQQQQQQQQQSSPQTQSQMPQQQLPKPQQALTSQQQLPKPQQALTSQQQLPKPQQSLTSQQQLPKPQQSLTSQQQLPKPQQSLTSQQQLPKPHYQQLPPQQLFSYQHYQQQYQYPLQQQHFQHQQQSQFHHLSAPPPQFQILVQHHILLQNKMQERSNQTCIQEIPMEGQKNSSKSNNVSNGHSLKNHLDRRGAGDYDEYAGLMTIKQRTWLRSIQLIQLTTDKPHLDDYYYNEWLKKQEKNVKKKPQTKNGMKKDKNVAGNRQNQNSGGNRDRKNTERDSITLPSPKVYVPLNFENSLGKLQCVSVTAPRKIIDLDVVSEPQTEATPVSTHRDSRKTKKVLLELERLYLMVMDVEEIDANIRMEDKKFTKPELTNKIMSSFLNENRFANFMCIRKGKNLLLRMLKHLTDSDYNDLMTDLWCRTIKSLHAISRRDQNDGLLLKIYPFFKKWLNSAPYEKISVIINFLLSENIAPSAKSVSRAVSPVSGKTVLSVCLATKFGASIITCILTRGELMYTNMEEKEQIDWSSFLSNFMKQAIAFPNLDNVQSPFEPLNPVIMATLLNRTSGVHLTDYASIKKVLNCFQ